MNLEKHLGHLINHHVQFLQISLYLMIFIIFFTVKYLFHRRVKKNFKSSNFLNDFKIETIINILIFHK